MICFSCLIIKEVALVFMFLKDWFSVKKIFEKYSRFKGYGKVIVNMEVFVVFECKKFLIEVVMF